MRTTLRTATWFLAGMLLASTAWADEVREELHETYTLAPEGRVSLDNINGSVRIATWDRPEVKVDAVKKAKRAEDLDEVTIEIKTNANHVRIHTEYPDTKNRGWFKWGNSTWVDYELTVPVDARLKDISTVNGGIDIQGSRADVKANTVNGTVKVRNHTGRVNVSTVNGRVEAGLASLDGVKSVSATTVNGSVDVTLPHGANADISASTVNGGISGDVPVKRNWPVGATANAKLGEGGTKVSVSTVNGGIEIHVAKPAE
jgi:DUF4097 and DUF4098 domain-containing protein YvlB